MFLKGFLSGPLQWDSLSPTPFSVPVYFHYAVFKPHNKLFLVVLPCLFPFPTAFVLPVPFPIFICLISVITQIWQFLACLAAQPAVTDTEDFVNVVPDTKACAVNPCFIV